MVGQEKILNKLHGYTVDTFPRSIMLVGEKGSGKHTICDIISKEIIKFPLIDITSLISYEYIDAIYRNPNPSIYIINLSELTEKAQTVILKFVEEPPSNAFIIALSEHKNLVLNTVLNRCIVFELEQYTKIQLEQFVSDGIDVDLATNLIRTPGKLLSTNLKTFEDARELCCKIIDKIQLATYPNTLSISNKVNYKDEYDKIDLELFFDLLCNLIVSRYKIENNIRLLKMYEITREHRKSLLDKRVNKQLMFENYLTELWLSSRSS